MSAKSSATCCASSRVGTRTSAAGAASSDRSRSTIGSANASVLPEPVCERARTSLPAVASSMTRAWIGKGAAIPRAARALMAASDTPRSAKVVVMRSTPVWLVVSCDPPVNRGGSPSPGTASEGGTGTEEPHGTTSSSVPPGYQRPPPSLATTCDIVRRMSDLARRIAIARGDEPADVVLRGGRVFSVFTGEFLDADVAFAGEHVAGVGDGYDGREIVDVSGLTLLPGFIDGHMHLESTKLMVDEFARAALPWGTTTVVLDPHEIANVFGLDGVRAILGSADAVPLDYYVMVSSCVPASEFESSGATVTAEEIAAFLAEEPNAIGVAEMMDFPGVVRGTDDAVAKLVAAGGRQVDGHAPGISGRALNAYLAAGVMSDHEITTLEEALEKRRLGMWGMIREGSAARNLEALLPLVLEHGPANTMFCTDDREPDHLFEQGHINEIVRKAVALGCRPQDAIVVATLNAARYHRLYEHGAVAPGYLADVVAVPDLESFVPTKVWKRGRLVATEGRAIDIPRVAAPDWMRGSIHVAELGAGAFAIAASERVRVIGVSPGSIITDSLVDEPGRSNGHATADVGRDLA